MFKLNEPIGASDACLLLGVNPDWLPRIAKNQGFHIPKKDGIHNSFDAPMIQMFARMRFEKAVSVINLVDSQKLWIPYLQYLAGEIDSLDVEVSRIEIDPDSDIDDSLQLAVLTLHRLSMEPGV